MKPVYFNTDGSKKTMPEKPDTSKVSKLKEIDIGKKANGNDKNEEKKAIDDKVEKKEAAKESTPPPKPAEVTQSFKRPKRKALKKFANLGKGPACKSCKKPVGIANRVKACKGLYHDTCFRCSTCDKIIRNGEYVDRNDNPYCLICHKRGFGPKGFGYGLNDALHGTTNKAEEKKGTAKVVTESWV